VIYNPIGLVDNRFDRPMTPIDESYRQTLKSDYQSIRASLSRYVLSRYVAHNPSAWNADFEAYTRIRYSWSACCCFPGSAMSRTSRRPTRCCRRLSSFSRRDWPSK
jgi:hypothetical protein